MTGKTTMDSSLAADYAAKREDYYDCPRAEMLDFLPATCRTVLDVGCGRGALGAGIRRLKGCEVWGVEPDPDCIAGAQANLDKVFHGLFGPELELPERHFDCIYFNDVLEHMMDPLPALKYAAKLLSKNGCVIASIPNIGHFPVVWKLMVHGLWDYKERGILDKTHFRFYTRASISRLFQEAGYKVQRVEGINPFFSMEPEDSRLWRIYRLFSWVPKPGIRDMRYLQFAVVANRKD